MDKLSNSFTVSESTELLKFLLKEMPTKGRNKVKSILSRGQVSVEGKAVTKHNLILKQGQTVTINWSWVVEENTKDQLDILFEDSDIIAIDKPAGQLSIATGKEKLDTAYRRVTEYVKRSGPKNRIFVVHRLDRGTSGVMIFTKDEKVKRQLQDSWKEVSERVYVALVEGVVKKEAGTITSWLKESKTLQMFSSPKPNGGQKAITHYKVLKTTADYSLLEVRLETGRKNQIRVHMQDLGHSVAGDKKYGSTKNPIGRLGLHAKTLALKHPTTGEVIRCETEIPKKFISLFN